MTEPPLHLLLIEDNPADVRLFQAFLQESATPFILTHVERLQPALACLHQQNFDVVLLDLTLPDSQGLETFLTLYHHAPNLPLIVLTGLDDETLALRALQEGAQDYLMKGQITSGLWLSRTLRYAIERQRIQTQLQDQECQFRAIFNSTLNAIVIVDDSGQFVDVNPPACDLFQLPKATLLHTTILDFVVLDPESQMLRPSIFSPTKLTGEIQIRRPDQTLHAVEYAATLNFLPHRHLAVLQDVSDRKLAEQKIRQQASLLDIATDAILVRGLQHHILFWSKGAERIYGWRANEACGQTANTLLFDAPSAEIETAIQTVLAQGEWQGELTKITKYGHTVIVESRWALVLDEQQQPHAILSVDTDITERKQLQSQALRTQRLESIGTLASGIAHDLNNILTPILASAQLIQHKLPTLDEQTQRLLHIIEDSTRRGADLIKQVLAFTRGVEGKHMVLQIRHLVADFQKVIRETFPKSIEVHIQIAPDLWVISGDSTQLHQVLMNLCVNARDAMPQGGHLSLSVQNQQVDAAYTRINLEAQAGNYVVITVADTGVGIDASVMDRIFEPFFTTKAHGLGTGLGLSTVMGITKSHGGFVEVSSQIAEGTQFRIFLPAAAATNLEAPPPSAYPRGQGELVLVVDDEATICETAQASLELWGYQVLQASNGLEAIDCYRQHHEQICLVLIDLFMPIMSGGSAIQRLQQLNPRLNIVAMSGLGPSPPPTACPLPPDLPFLPKPFSADDLLQCINQVLRGNPSTQS
ncbi:response regulator [Synechococcales cyanobacterium C]|uniref:histidine kinase n=1 Tax=Petrachloros mirabilis ULC683 TaxID=2781853 RepID=A0A8K2A7T1_9CYAN|nr:response regulator [Petrachloros mirabilis]NCJ06275.1 response regulator [Petrachloros mirabilis ULC683]